MQANLTIIRGDIIVGRRDAATVDEGKKLVV
jgi:hypothetical protein